MRPAEFADAIRSAVSELRLEPSTPVRLNQIAAEIDQLGRRLHGLDWIRDQEIGESLTAAVRELGLARNDPEIRRHESVWRALFQLESALIQMDMGLRVVDPGTEPTERRSALDSTSS